MNCYFQETQVTTDVHEADEEFDSNDLSYITNKDFEKHNTVFIILYLDFKGLEDLTGGLHDIL